MKSLTQEVFSDVGKEWELSEELFIKLQKFTCQLYNSKDGTDDVNMWRYMLFCAKKGGIESTQLPPCADCLRKHCQSANYQAKVWRQSLTSCPIVPDPTGFGWCQEKDDNETIHLVIDWMSGNPAPKAVLEFLSCKCTRSCMLPNCSCLENGLKCTDMCFALRTARSEL